MILGIDASNIRGGGGLTHLVELLKAAEPGEQAFERVIVWGGMPTLSRIEDRPWLQKIHESLLDRALPARAYWQQCKLGRRGQHAGCDVLFVPGGSYGGAFGPFVTMSQNMLPFERRERGRYGLSATGLRLRMLRRSQERTFAQADGVIFLTEYARKTITAAVSTSVKRSAVIPHGVSQQFTWEGRKQKRISEYSHTVPFRCLYVSSVTMYKHQWKVVEAIALLRKRGYPIVLDLIGPATSKRGLSLLHRSLRDADPSGAFVSYCGAVPHAEIAPWYRRADLFVFASSCENMPNILLEAMAAGLPIACSALGPMPDMLGDHGVYFHPEDPETIAQAIGTLVDNLMLRTANAIGAATRARAFSWHRCARETFAFLSYVATDTYAGNT